MEENQTLVKKIKEDKKKFNFKGLALIFFLVAGGIASGYFLSLKQVKNKPAKKAISRNIGDKAITKGMVVGVSDEKTFKDLAEGKLEKGGIDGEGSHHLTRPGGDSQTVYLTSSLIDLDKFVGRKVKIWGETFSAKKAGWLMDVGRLEVL